MGKHFRISGSTILAGICKTLCVPILGLIVYTEGAAAATYFISPMGADSSTGTAIASPWKTFPFAMSRTVCGDTVVLMNGTYTLTAHGPFEVAKSCTASTVFTVQAQNERAAFISGDGSVNSLRITSSAYVTIKGLRVKSADFAPCTNQDVVLVTNSDHITLTRMLVHENNRYCNTHLIDLQFSDHVLVEESELYNFHRHGILIYFGGSNIVRRVYGHSRAHADVAGGYVSATTNQGESCVAIYPSSDNILENIICENALSIAETNASSEASMGRRNQFLGNILLGTRTYGTNSYYGYIITARSNTAAGQPRDNTFKNNVIINIGDETSGGGVGIFSRSSYNTRVENATVINARVTGFVADEVAATGGGTYSFFCTNCLSIGNDVAGFSVTSDIQTWTISRPNAYQNRTNYSLLASITNLVNKLEIDARLGACYVWIPDASPMKRAGVNGADVGANILYRYQNGVLTNVPLWNPTTGEFPHGALVAGLNDVPGQSLFDVHKRLNVNTNGCSFPANYGDGVTDADAPRAPVGLSVF
jgi:hypothetical protein